MNGFDPRVVFGATIVLVVLLLIALLWLMM